MSALGDRIIAGTVNPIEGKVVEVPSHHAINDKKIVTGSELNEKGAIASDIQEADSGHQHDNNEKDHDDDDVIIITGADAAAHLLPLRDDGEPALTFRSIVLATCLSGFQAVMNQIYNVRVSVASMSDMS